MEEHCGNLVDFHLPERAFLWIIYWNFCPVWCKHTPSYRPPLCRAFINTEDALSNVSVWAAMKYSLCELKRGPVPACLLHSAKWEPDPCCWIIMCFFPPLRSAHFIDENILLWTGLWSAYTRKWYIVGVTFQEKAKWLSLESSQDCFIYFWPVKCTFKSAVYPIKASWFLLH